MRHFNAIIIVFIALASILFTGCNKMKVKPGPKKVERSLETPDFYTPNDSKK